MLRSSTPAPGEREARRMRTVTSWFHQPDLDVGVSHGALQLHHNSDSGRLEWASAVKKGSSGISWTEATTVFPAVAAWAPVRLSTDGTGRKKTMWRPAPPATRAMKMAAAFGEEALPLVVDPWQIGSTLAKSTIGANEIRLAFPIGDFQQGLGLANVKFGNGKLELTANADSTCDFDQSILQIEAPNKPEARVLAIRDADNLHILAGDPSDIRRKRTLASSTMIFDCRWQDGSDEQLAYLTKDGKIKICAVENGATTKIKRRKRPKSDEQDVTNETRFGQIFYAGDGRLFHTDAQTLTAIDPRSPKSSETELYSVKNAKGKPAAISDHLKDPNREHRHILATSNAVTFVDDRMPGHPLMNWRHHRSSSTHLRLAALPSTDSTDHVILYSTRDGLRTVLTLTLEAPPQMLSPPEMIQDKLENPGFAGLSTWQPRSALETFVFGRASNGQIALTTATSGGNLRENGTFAPYVQWDKELSNLAIEKEKEPPRKSQLYNFRLHYEEIFDSNVTDQPIENIDFDPSAFLSKRPEPRTASPPQRIGYFEDTANPPHITYAHFLPMRVNPERPGEIDVENKAARILLSEWTIGGDPFSISFEQPTEIETRGEDLFGEPKTQSRQEQVKAPAISTKAARPVASTSRIRQTEDYPASQPPLGECNATFGHSQRQSTPVFAQSQIVRGQHGGRPPPAKTKKKKLAGF